MEYIVINGKKYESNDYLKKSLDDWYNQTDFEDVHRITNINCYDYPEADDVKDGYNGLDRDGAIDLAKSIWDKMSLNEKVTHYGNYGDGYDLELEQAEVPLPKYEVGKDYKYTHIQSSAVDAGFEEEGFGNGVIGEDFTVLKKDNTTVSFVLTGYADGYVYTCVYSNQ